MKKGPDIEDLVTNAMGNSVTPSRLQESKKPGILRRVLGNETVEGPFIEDLDRDEQPHYLFHTTNKIEIPEGLAEDGAIFSIFGQSKFSPGTLLVTDTQLMLIYNNGRNRRVRRFDYFSINHIEYSRLPRLERSLNFTTVEGEFAFEMWDTEKFGDELSDAAAYISEKSNAEYTESTYDFEGGQYEDAIEALQSQLDQMGTIAREVDTTFVLRYAKRGAKVGKDTRTVALGFLLGAGYGIWADIQRSESDHPVSEDPPTFDPDQIDPESTAEEIVRWKQLGD